MLILKQPMLFNIPFSFCLTDEDKNVACIPEEEFVLIKNKSMKRQRDFITGRFCAHNALNAINVKNVIIKNGNKGPVWPEKVKGSISHSKKLAGALVTTSQKCHSCGLDIENAKRVISKSAVKIFANDDEIKIIENNRTLANVIFSVKESVYKCLSVLGLPRVFFNSYSVKFLENTFPFIDNENMNEYCVVFHGIENKIPHEIHGGYCFINDEIISICVIS